MTTIECPMPREPTLDRTRASSTVPRMSREDQLRDQNWERITAQLTTFAWNRIRRRSWETAQELAQDAIAAAWAKNDGWDPEKEPLLKHLSKRVIGLASNEWRRKRNSFEAKMSYERLAELPAAIDAPTPDEELDRRRHSALFSERLSARLAGDELATMLVTLMTEGIATPRDQASATGRAIADIREARRRVFYNAGEVSKELAKELDIEDENDPVARDAAADDTEEEASP